MKQLYLPVVAAAMVCAAQSGTSAANERRPAEFLPTSDWVIDFGDDYCRLSRSFSDGEHELLMALERLQPGYPSRLILVGDGLRPFRSTETVGYRFAPSTTRQTGSLLQARTAEGDAFYDLGLTSLLPEGLAPPVNLFADEGVLTAPDYDAARERELAATIDHLVISEGLYRPVNLHTGNLQEPISALQQCALDLVDHWGLDGARHAQASRAVHPEGFVSDWLPQVSLRPAQWATLRSDRSGVRVLVNEAGAPTSCEVQGAASGEDPSHTICDALLENGQFQPALDADGEPMRSYWMVDRALLLATANGHAPRGNFARSPFSYGSPSSIGQNPVGQGQPSSAALNRGN